jgi:tyrosinase
LWELPSVDTEFSAAQNHFDDFVAVHMNQTNFIHGTANFLTWHRYLMWLWEQKLRNLCGYTGYLPVGSVSAACVWDVYRHQSDSGANPHHSTGTGSSTRMTCPSRQSLTAVTLA